MRVLPGPTKSNQALAWSPDGRFVVAGGSGDGVMVWDVAAGTPGQLALTGGHGGEALRFCPRTGRLIVAFRSGGVWSLDPDTGAERRHRPADYRITYLSPALSPDGRTVIFRRSSYINSRSEYAIVAYAIAADGAWEEAWTRPDGGSPRGEGRFDFAWNPRTGHLFSPGGPWGAPTAFEWSDPRTGALVGACALPPGALRAGSPWVLAPDGEQVAWLSAHALYAQRLDEPDPRALPAGPEVYRRGLAWAPDGRTLAVASGGTVRLLDAATLAEVRAFDWGIGNVRAVAFAPDGLRAAVSGDSGRGWAAVFDLDL